MAKGQVLDKATEVMVQIQEDQADTVRIQEDQEDMVQTLEDQEDMELAMGKGQILMQELILLLKVPITQVNLYNSNLVLTLIAIALLLSHKEDAAAI